MRANLSAAARRKGAAVNATSAAKGEARALRQTASGTLIPVVRMGRGKAIRRHFRDKHNR